jgi:predicted ATPase/class 3 adenylate cyclase
MPQRTVTLLFTDIEGSTKLWEAFGDGMRQALPKHDQLIKRAIDQHNGTVFKTVGDGFFCVFQAPADAVQAAIAIQKSIHETPWPVPGLRVRCSLHTGTVESRGGDYYGVALSRAARMLGVGYGGQTLLSEATRALVHRELPADAWLYDHGPQRLKDLEGAENLFELRHPDIPVEMQGLRTINERPNNLPEPITSFVGREAVIEQIRASLQKSRMVTLIGSGGSGKTRAALEAAGGLLDDYPDGVWFVDLSPVIDETLVTKAVASVLNVREQAGAGLADALIEYAEPRNLLLILDNCEHVVEESAKLATALLTNCAQVSVLATSRESLGVVGEMHFRVPSMQVPSPEEDPEKILATESARLFVERAQLADQNFQPTPTSAKSIARIVSRLDGIPLAIELAAARASTMSTEALSARLDESFRILTGGSKAALPRQQTLRAMIDWSYNLLSGQEQAMLRRLGVFSGGWTLETAESVCTDGDLIHRDDVLDLLLQLVGKSLVIYEEVSARYRLLETVRWYALQKLAESEESADTRNRHLRTFLKIAEDTKLTGANQVEDLARLETEHENILAALDWCDASPEGAEAGLRLVAALGRFWYMHGHFASGRRAISHALARTGAQVRTQRRGEALIAAALLARVQGDLKSAEDFLLEAQAVYRKLDDNKGLSTVLNSLGNVMREGGRFAEAKSVWLEALEIRKALEDRPGIAVVRGNLGIVSMFSGDYDEAEDHIQASLAEERALQRRSHEGIALSNLGLLKMWKGDLPGAKACCLLALEVNREVGTKLVESRDLHHLGQIELDQGNLDDARGYLQDSLKISGTLTAKELMADAIETVAALMNRTGDHATAAKLAGGAERIRHESGCAMAPNEEGRYKRENDAFCSALGKTEAQRLMEIGRAMKSSEALELAVSALSKNGSN